MEVENQLLKIMKLLIVDKGGEIVIAVVLKVGSSHWV
jgi:hypothetical protein